MTSEKKRDKVNLERYRLMMLQIGFLLALALVWLILEWPSASFSPRQHNWLAIDLQVERVAIRNPHPDLSPGTAPIELKSTITALQSQLGLPQSIRISGLKSKELPKIALVKFMLDTAGRVRQLEVLNCQRLDLRQATEAQFSHVATKLQPFFYNKWYIGRLLLVAD